MEGAIAERGAEIARRDAVIGDGRGHRGGAALVATDGFSRAAGRVAGENGGGKGAVAPPVRLTRHRRRRGERGGLRRELNLGAEAPGVRVVGGDRERETISGAAAAQATAPPPSAF